MVDFRKHRDVIREAVEKERKADEHWNWSVAAIRKNEVDIRWTYLSDDEVFTLREHGGNNDDFGDVFLIGKDPHNSFRVGVEAGEEWWCDARTIEEGIALAIHKIAYEAKSRY